MPRGMHMLLDEPYGMHKLLAEPHGKHMLLDEAFSMRNLLEEPHCVCNFNFVGRYFQDSQQCHTYKYVLTAVFGRCTVYIYHLSTCQIAQFRLMWFHCS